MIAPNGTDSMTYDNGQLQTIDNPIGGITTITRDSDGKIASQISPVGCRTSFAWTAGGIEKVETPKGGRTTFGYQEQNNKVQALQKIIFPDGSRYTFVYDTTKGLVKGSIDQLGCRTTLLWDGYKRKAVIDPLGNRTTYGYDGAHVKSVTNPLENVSTWTYNANKCWSTSVESLPLISCASTNNGNRKHWLTR
jgi:YD repeat-containing protein